MQQFGDLRNQIVGTLNKEMKFEKLVEDEEL